MNLQIFTTTRLLPLFIFGDLEAMELWCSSSFLMDGVFTRGYQDLAQGCQRAQASSCA
jgi:hypothetical protein